jgi:CubicO group peptidase (beta-lactamase class C family)
VYVSREPPPGASGAPGWAAARFDREGIREVWLAGCADLRAKTPITIDLRFRWFSVTKLVTALAVASLVDRGLVRFDDPIDRHLPWCRPRDRSVTIAELLSHTAGFADPLSIGWVHPPGARRRTAFELTRATFDRHRALGPPRYTNLGYLVLGELVREVTGSFSDYVRSAILEPARIHARFAPGGAVGHEPLRSMRALAMAIVFLPRTRGLVRYVEDGWVGLTPFELEGEAYGGLVGSLGDIVRLGRVHFDGSIDGVRIVSADVLALMREPRGSFADPRERVAMLRGEPGVQARRETRGSATAAPKARWRGGGFGLGCEIYGGGWIGHGGEAGGFRAELRIHPRGEGVAVLASSGVANVRETAERLSRS